ncbi:MAG: PEP-CTERM sorting domain-containing protein [Massilia sp.]
MTDVNTATFEGIVSDSTFSGQGTNAAFAGINFDMPAGMYVIGANYAEGGGTFGTGTGASLFGYNPGFTISLTDGGLFNAFALKLRGYYESSTSFNISFSDGESFNVTANNPAGAYFGVTLDHAVSSVFIGTASSYIDLDNVSYARAAVPEPASIALMGLGIAGLIGTRRRKAAKQ